MPLFKKKPHDGTSQPLIPPPEPTSPPAYAPSAPVPSSSYQPRLASLSFHMTDRIRLLHFPPEAIDVCRSTILSAWKPPHSGAIVIQDERPYGASHEFKLRGFPWALGSYQPVESSRLVCALLSTLHGLGWTLILTTDVTRKMRDKDTLVFRRRRMCLWSVTGAWSCFREATGCVPPEVSQATAAQLGPSWVQARSVHKSVADELKLHGSPWFANGIETMRVRELLLVLLESLEDEGWTVFASIDQKHGRDDYTETDTWYCCRPKGWVKGAPLYHN
ncbi:hypothetical protein BU26DRAFT_603220 [Trematosphaeria pertusa]|uniref:Uncharacterized protein n=1 Tax=Trematosphaeria pertusa TaxID=390896 RepID=A0A6A6IJA2_9PLEO|nr:uncharacterized protein BU26DRAFT_603220 [Trematosphaeria pertusa]KAF2250654.1 hypothetical protein BU26DRAFT_603220 [Trematosphaeria pertusa]